MRICIYFVMTTFFSLEAQYFAEDLSVFFIAVVLAQRRSPQPESNGEPTLRHAALLTPSYTPNISKLAALYIIRTLFNTASSVASPLRFSVSEDAGIEPRTAATFALVVRRYSYSARYNPLT
jgi:hypothetical protein